MLLWWIAGNPAAAEEITLREALDRALGENLELRQAGIELERSEAAVQLIRGGFDPTLSLGVDTSVSASPSNDADDNNAVVHSTATGFSASISQALPTGAAVGLGWSESLSSSDSASQISQIYVNDAAWLSITQPLLAGGWASARADLKGALLSLSSQELSYRSAVEGLVLDVSAAYWGLVSAEEQQDLSEASETIAREQLSDITERFSEGFAGSGEVLQVQRALGVARQAAVIAQADVESARRRLARLIGLPLQESHALRPTQRPTTSEETIEVEASLALARRHNTAWLQASLTAQQASLSLTTAQIDTLPDLDISGSIGLAGGAEGVQTSRQQIVEVTNPTWAVGADLSVPIPGRTPRAQRARVRMSREQARLALLAAEQDLIGDVLAAVNALRRDRARVQLAEQTLEAAQLALDADRELHREGLASTREVILSLEALNEAQVSMLSARIDLQSSMLSLKRIEGGLLESLAITPP